MHVQLAILCLLVPLFSPSRCHETFREELQLRKLENGDLLVILEVQQSSNGSRYPQSFPLAIDVAAHDLSLHAWQLTFVQGHWVCPRTLWHPSETFLFWQRREKWGAAPFDVHPHGAELVAWMESGTENHQILAVWRHLTYVLSGLFCASLDAVKGSDQMISSSREWDALVASIQMKRVHAFVPQEPVCVENLTPWLKFSPCKGKKGLASIFHPQSLYQGDFHLLQTRMEKSKWNIETQKYGVELVQRLVVVYPASVLKSASAFQKLLRQPSFDSCPVADAVSVSIDPQLPLHLTQLSEDATHREGLETTSAKTTSVGRMLNPFGSYRLGISPDQPSDGSDDKGSGRQTDDGGLFQGETFLIGNHGDRGTFALEMHRSHSSSNSAITRLCLLQSFPWKVRIWMHTLRLWINHEEVSNLFERAEVDFELAEDRTASTVLHLCLDLTEQDTSLSLTLEYAKAFLFIEEHPPDAYRGVDIPPTIVHHLIAANGSESSRVVQSYLDGGLVRILVPDFSMPYNVCCLTCTVLALYVGVLLKLLTASTVETAKDASTTRKRTKLLIFLAFSIFTAYYYKDALLEVF